MFRKLLILAIIALCSEREVSAQSDTNYRLNTPIVPSAYALSITPYFDTRNDRAFTFDGEVSIDFTTTAVTNQIKLHAENLTFSAANITVTRGETVISPNNLINLVFEEKYSFAHINLNTNLEVGVQYTLRIIYTGPIREDLAGFYRNYYIENGVKKWLGATQFESTNARKAFPCFDEPGLKAVFTVTIDRPDNYQPSLSNMKLLNTISLSNGYVRETFYPTPKMSTYLVAFLVSEFTAAEYSINGVRELGVFARPDAANQSAYAFDFGKRVVDALGDYFGVDYYSTNNYLKLDHVALPDFRAGAMENWGLVKYREASLMYVEGESSPYYRYRVAQIIAHETAHMWFGNLVTCHWWSNTWLNEGFANYFQDYITALIQPEVGSEDILVTGSVYAALDADESINSTPISNDNVNSPDEISGNFGTITYQKGGSVIRMMHHLLGDQAFKFGLNAYLTANQFDSGYPDRLYSALSAGQAVTNSMAAYPETNITEVMSSWITQAGHPVLHVEVDYEENKVTLKQKRFYSDADRSSEELYKIPITYTTGNAPNFLDTKPAFIMGSESHEFTIPSIGQSHSWVIFNVQETGLYRVNYDDHSWQIIAEALKGNQREQIHHLNRAKIVNDLFAFLYADEVDFDRLYDVLEFLHEETDYSVWLAAIRGFNKLRNSYLGSDILNDIEAYERRLMNNIIEKLGYEPQPTDGTVALQNRLQILLHACKIGHQGCHDKAAELFQAFRQNGTSVTASLRQVVYCYGLRQSNGDEYEFLWNRMSTTNIANEARLIGDILGCTTDEDNLRKFLVSMLEENSPVKLQDLTQPLNSVLAHYNNVDLVLDELNRNYTLWSSIYGSMGTVLNTVANSLRTKAEFDKFESWLLTCTQCEEETVNGAKRALESAKASTEWAEDHKSDIIRTLRSSGFSMSFSIPMLIAGLMTAYVFKM